LPQLPDMSVLCSGIRSCCGMGCCGECCPAGSGRRC